MKKVLSLVLVLMLILTTVSCRPNTPSKNITSSDALSSEMPETTSEIQSAVCYHTITITQNITSATCDTNGYTGDVFCADCHALISNGTTISPIGHDTEIRNSKAATTSERGYTGDTYCKVCGVMTSLGQDIPPIQESIPIGKLKYTTDNGYVYIVDEGTDITDFSMKQQTQYVTHYFYNIELEILNLCNIEREKVGLAPLTWYEDAYYFTNTRAQEIYSKWDHKRPDGTDWHTVYTNADVLLTSCAENLAQQQGSNEIASMIVNAWMQSTKGHRESILNPNFTKVAIAVNYVEEDYTYYVAQHFFA